MVVAFSDHRLQGRATKEEIAPLKDHSAEKFDILVRQMGQMEKRSEEKSNDPDQKIVGVEIRLTEKIDSETIEFSPIQATFCRPCSQWWHASSSKGSPEHSRRCRFIKNGTPNPALKTIGNGSSLWAQWS